MKPLMNRRYLFPLIISSFLIIAGPQPGHADMAAEFFAKQDQRYNGVIVQEVISADTIIIDDYIKKGEKIRLAGIKAPAPFKEKHTTAERDQYGFVIKEEHSPVISIEEEALNFTKKLLEG